MSNVVYLLIVVGISAVGLVILWARTRAPSSPRSSVEQFNDKMRALAPDDDRPGDTAGRSRRGA
jgi:hypothetical protein